MRNAHAQRLLKAPLLWTTAALVGGILLHIDRVPLWISAASFLCIAWRLAAEARLIRLPGQYAKIGVALLLIGAIFARFQTLNGLTAGTALLVVMGGIKMLETHSRRDRYVVIGATAFLLLAACLDRQGLLRAPLYLVHAWICCTALATVAHEGASLTNRAAAGLAARTLALAVPLAVVLFLFFPRIVGGFWTLPQSDAAVTGLSDRMSPGDISSLSESDDPAFRVRFIGDTPPPEERYWRGPVLHDFDGFTWTRSNRFYRQPKLEPVSPLYRYRVTLEPSSQRWWFALDTVRDAPSHRVLLTFDYQLWANEPVTRPTTFEAVSATRTITTDPLSVLARRVDTQLPERPNPRSRDLARQLRAQVGSDREYIDSVLQLFRRGGFEYTLTPPRLDRNSVDDFLFNTHKGFCGHYASAFVTLMRAAGVPARVVTGYLGGEWNPIGQYFLVRQSDAHAWAEVWLDGQGWSRIDPTAVVAPERLRRGLYDLLPDSLSAPARFLRETPWILDLRQRWDALNDWWNERFVRFDFNLQLDLLRMLGIEASDWHALGWLFAGGLVAWLGFISWQVGRALRAAPVDPLARAYLQLCAKLARAGAPRGSHEGPHAYAESIARRRADLADSVRALLHRYADLRYGRLADAQARTSALREFARDVTRFRAQRVR